MPLDMFHPLIAGWFRERFGEPTEPQRLGWPAIAAGSHTLIAAPTGSGKTLAFGIGAVARLAGKPSRPGHPRVLVLTPTRELCAQVASEIETLAAARGLRVASFYGGVGYGPQLKSLARGVDVAVACPGRLTDLIERRSIHLGNVEIVVIDEADRMADMGFLPDVRRLLDKTPDSRQTVLFSATLDGDIDVLVRRYQNKPARHEIEATEESISLAHHVFWRVAAGDRVGTAADVVTASGPTIIFCRTKHATDRMARQLDTRGVRAAAIHGDRSQKQRERALASFMRGDVDALVATDVAARGIHVDGVAAVVHFDPPADAKDYVHRSGRTARAGASGVVVSLVTPDKAGAVRKLQRDLGVPTITGAPDLAALAAALGEGSVESVRKTRAERDARVRRHGFENTDRPNRSGSGSASGGTPHRKKRPGDGSPKRTGWSGPTTSSPRRPDRDSGWPTDGKPSRGRRPGEGTAASKPGAPSRPNRHLKAGTGTKKRGPKQGYSR
ncbi:MAG: DEAD/DEAH box helicase [Acidimicrobiales bacterium]